MASRYKHKMRLKLKKGALHKAMGVTSNRKLSVAALKKAKNSKSPLMRKRANFALVARKWHH